MSLKVSSVFEDQTFMPSKYTCEGADVNPPFKIEGVDSKVVSLAIVVDDPDAPIGIFVHWLAWNILPVKEISENFSESSVKFIEGKNGFGRIGYNGPCPPRGHGVHHYHFKVYALDSMLNLKAGSHKRALENAMKNHIIDQSEIVGLYRRE